MCAWQTHELLGPSHGRDPLRRARHAAGIDSMLVIRGTNDAMPFFGHDPVPKIDVEAAAAELEHGAQMIEVGEPDDWFKGYIKGALLVEPELVDIEVAKLRGATKLIVAARDPDLAEDVTAALREKHWDAVALEGGPGAWQRSGRAVVRPL